ncbi:MAG: HlyC/CorC family transporter [Chlamydiia bacterium]|nr:HlyC/CorC family transporter [Chlamydiia bacterium]
MADWAFFLILVLVSLIIQGFYSMLEMASVSFNRVRLQFYVSQGNRRAKWLSYLLNHPTRLFGTTLIGVNAAMQFGSECARRFYSSLDISPDWAPITQIFVVLIFAELSPMFAARRYAENVCMLGVPIIYITSFILRPLIFILDLICRLINVIFGVKASSGLYLTREELQKAIEEREDVPHEELDPVLINIFSLKSKTAKNLMDPLEGMKCIGSEKTVGDLKKLLNRQPFPFIPVYHKSPKNIVAVAYPRDLLRHSDETRLRAYCRPPWFITQTNSILEIMKEFRQNNQSLAIVLNEKGEGVGTLTLDAVVDEIFGHRDDWISFGEYTPEQRKVLVDRSFPGSTLVADINKWLHINLPIKEEGETLEELMELSLGRRPDLGDTVRVDSFELSVEETSLIAGRTILISSVS